MGGGGEREKERERVRKIERVCVCVREGRFGGHGDGEKKRGVELPKLMCKI